MEQYLNYNTGGVIREVFLSNASDWKLNKNGEWELKRRYGKFKRLVYKYENNASRSTD